MVPLPPWLTSRRTGPAEQAGESASRTVGPYPALPLYIITPGSAAGRRASLAPGMSTGSIGYSPPRHRSVSKLPQRMRLWLSRPTTEVPGDTAGIGEIALLT